MRAARRRAGRTQLKATSGRPDARAAPRSYEDIGEEDDWEAADRDSEPEDGDEAAEGGEPAKKQAKGKDGKVRAPAGDARCQGRARQGAQGPPAVRGAHDLGRQRRARCAAGRLFADARTRVA